ncbi:hypothetical protein BH925_05105 [Rodentibacter pneumotropicus]|uniref:DUF2644 domain-containing protein n=1 Tax=Rodentibacter pneumotropicus TaxID=758 RepID=UPI000989770A|nr:hypothetical protein BH925_05105 [Rodentibacter pneumotropicus]
MSNKFVELFTNNDGRASTTGFIQFFGFLVMAGVLVYSVYLDRAITTDLYFYFACFCGGSAATKGAVAAYQSRAKSETPSQTEPEDKPRGI